MIALRRVRVDPALEVDEFLVGALRQLAHQVFVREAERLGQFRQALRVLEQFLRVAPDRLHRRGHRQRLAVAVGDHAARGRDRDLAQEARIALALVEIVVDHLQVDRARQQRQRAHAEGAGDQRQAATQVELRAVARALPFLRVRANQALQRRRGALQSVTGAAIGFFMAAPPRFHPPAGTPCRGDCARPGRRGCSRPRSPVPAAGGRTRC